MQNSTTKNQTVPFFILTESSLKRLKLKAQDLERKLKATNNIISHHDALNSISQKYSFESWKSLFNSFQHETQKGLTSALLANDPDLTVRQLIGAYYRANKISPKNVQNHIHISITCDTYDFLHLAPDTLLREHGLFIDVDFFQHLIMHTNYYQDLGLNFDDTDETEIIVRLFGIDTNSPDKALSHFLDTASVFCGKSPPDLPNSIWINGQIASDSNILFSGQDFSYMEMPESIWGDMYQ